MTSATPEVQAERLTNRSFLGSDRHRDAITFAKLEMIGKYIFKAECNKKKVFQLKRIGTDAGYSKRWGVKSQNRKEKTISFFVFINYSALGFQFVINLLQ